MIMLGKAARVVAALAGLAALSMLPVLWHMIRQPAPLNYEVFPFARNVFAACDAPPELYRTVRCDTFVNYWIGCRGSARGCSIEKTHKILERLEFDPPPLHLDPKAKLLTDQDIFGAPTTGAFK
jgi:hypothetical protein